MKKIILVLIIPIVTISLFIFKYQGSLSSESRASQIFTRCKFSNDPTLCYEKEIPKLMKSLTMEETFKITSLIQEKDQNFPYCHVLSHKLASIETAKNPDDWKSVASRCPSGICSNGCVHGAFQEKFRDETLSDEKIETIKNELSEICEKREGFDPSELEQSSCYHALGHLFMYITGGSVDRSLRRCDELTKKSDGRDFTRVCFDGVFMQIFQPLDKDDEALVYGKVPTKSEVESYCFRHEGEKRYSCWNESWPLYLEEITTPSGLLSFCSKLDKKGEESCVTDVLYLIPIEFRFDEIEMKKYCNSFGQKEAKCFSVFAARVLEIDYKNKQKALSFCDSISNESGVKECYDYLTNYAKFVFKKDGEDIREFCSLVEEKGSDCSTN